MGAAPQVYSPLVWYIIDGRRVAYKVFNRADNPQPGAPPIDFPSYQFIEYAGDGQWRSEEDVWLLPEMKNFARPILRRRRQASPRHWNCKDSVAMIGVRGWTGRARNPGHKAAPSWLDKAGFTPFSSLRTSTLGSGHTDAVS